MNRRKQPGDSGATIIASGSLLIRSTLERAGADWRQVLRKVGFDPDRNYDPNDSVDLRKVLLLCEECAAVLDDDAIGARMGSSAPIGMAMVFDYVALSATTLDRAITNWVRFQNLPSNAIQISREDDKDVTYLHWMIPDNLGPRTQFTDMLLAFSACRLRYMAGDIKLPLLVELSHKAPKNLAAIQEIFGQQITFDAPADKLGVPKVYLSAMPRTSEPNLLSIMERAALKALEHNEQQSDQLFMITDRIAAGLKTGDTSLEAVSRALGMSRRSVQRVLENAGTTYRQLVDEVRKNLARRYLLDSELQLSEIAYLLGYSELSAFSRAAKGWFGTSAKQYRKAQSTASG